MRELEASQVQFIQCIQPAAGAAAAPVGTADRDLFRRDFDTHSVLRQLRSTGACDVVEVSRVAFPVRVAIARIRSKLQAIGDELPPPPRRAGRGGKDTRSNWKVLDDAAFARELLAAANVREDSYLIGSKSIFLRPGAADFLSDCEALAGEASLQLVVQKIRENRDRADAAATVQAGVRRPRGAEALQGPAVRGVARRRPRPRAQRAPVVVGCLRRGAAGARGKGGGGAPADVCGASAARRGGGGGARAAGPAAAAKVQAAARGRRDRQRFGRSSGGGRRRGPCGVCRRAWRRPGGGDTRGARDAAGTAGRGGGGGARGGGGAAGGGGGGGGGRRARAAAMARAAAKASASPPPAANGSSGEEKGWLAAAAEALEWGEAEHRGIREL